MSNHEFCRACGARLIVTLGQIHHYNSQTSVPIFKAWLRCPHKRQHWNPFDAHDAWVGTAEQGGGFVHDTSWMPF